MRRTTDDSSVECESGFKQRGESTLRVQWWQVILVFIAAVGFTFTWLLSHETRLTKVESSTEYIVSSINDFKTTLKETNSEIKKLSEQRAAYRAEK